MKIKRYDTTKQNSIKDAFRPCSDSVIDLSHWKPDSQSIRDRLIANSLSASGVPVYDFKSGIIPDDVNDTYFKSILALRNKALDLTELDEIRARLEIEVKTNVDNDRFNQIYEDLKKESSKSSETTVSEDSTSSES